MLPQCQLTVARCRTSLKRGLPPPFVLAILFKAFGIEKPVLLGLDPKFFECCCVSLITSLELSTEGFAVLASREQ